MQTQDELENQFNEDIDKIVKDFIKDFELKHEEEVTNLSEPLLRWQDFVARYIPPAPRQILTAKKFPKELDTKVKDALNHFKNLIGTGADINPYQSKGLIMHNDSSSNKRQQRTDLLWADWGIHHFHLTDTPIPSEKYFSDRSQWLLFCIIDKNFVGLIDVRDHNESDLFSNLDLLENLVESWPEIMEKFRINMPLALNKQYSSNEIAQLRKAGITAFITINDQVYMNPGMGITSASTPTRISLYRNRIRKHISELAKIVVDPANQFKQESTASGITDPEYSIALTENGLAIHEKKENKSFIFPRGTNNFISELNDLIAPEWAIDFSVKKSTNN